MALKSQGSALYFLGPAGVASLTEGAVYRVACFKSFDLPRGARGQIDTTCLDEEVASYLGGTITPGAATFTVDPDPAKQGHKELDHLYSSGTITAWAFCWSDGTTAPTSARGVGSIAVTNGGSGYTSAPTVVFTGGSGTGASATAVVENGVVVRIDVTAAGTGYTSAPAISFTGGSGTGAAATATLAYRLVAPTARTANLFDGYVSDYPVAAAVNAAITSTVSVQISGTTTMSFKS